MDVGTEVQILNGKHRGRTGRISKIYPGKGDGNVWPYYFKVQIEPGVTVEAVKTRLRPIQPL